MLIQRLKEAPYWQAYFLKLHQDSQAGQPMEALFTDILCPAGMEEVCQPESRNRIHFAVRMKTDMRLIGFVGFDWIYWNDHCGDLLIAIGDGNYLGKVELELIQKLSYYGFHELNLHRIECYVSQFEFEMEKNLITAGYLKEVTFREAEYFLNSYWDRFAYGLLRSEWIQKLESES